MNDQAQVADSLQLAQRGERLLAWAIDTVILFGILYGILSYFGVWDIAIQKSRDSLLFVLMMFVMNVVLFSILNGYLLVKHGQTLGKRIIGICIVDMKGNIPNASRVIFLRYLLFWVGGYLRVVGVFLFLADSLMIFRNDRRCLHDIVAGTQVVDYRR